MDWRNIPSLSALRAFEVAARLQNFSAAARELNVTHAAIAQHVRGLEAFFGQKLFLREGGKMALTDAGRNLAASLKDGFGMIGAGVRELQDAQKTRPLKIALTPAFAENWLMPRIGSFWTEHPETELAFVPGAGLVDLRRDGFDLAIRYGQGSWPGVNGDLLVPANYVVVGTPGLIGDVCAGDLAGLSALPWLIPPSHPEHQVWAAKEGFDFNQINKTDLPTNSLVLSATRAGHGLSIQARALIEADLEAGGLKCVYEADQSDLGYYIVTRPDFTSPALKAFTRWLKSCA